MKKMLMKKSLKQGLMVMLCFTVLFSTWSIVYPTKPVEAATVSVNTTAEIQNALINAQPGDTILVAPGTYELTTTTTVGVRSAYYYATVNGTSTNPITIQSEDPANPAVLKGGDIASVGYTLYITGDYWRINNIHVTHGQKGIILDNSNHTHINGVEVYHVGQEAIHVRDGSSNVIIENSFVNDTGATLDSTDMGFAEGYYVGSDRSVWKINEGTTGSKAAPGYGYDRKVYNTIIRNNTSGSLVRSEPLDIKEGASGTLVEGNTFLGGGIVGDAYNFADSFIDVKSYNSTIRNNVGYRQYNTQIDMDIHEIDRTSTDPWCPSNETSNKSLTNTSDGNTYSNNIFYEGNPPDTDTEAPTAPTSLSATAASSSQIDLIWNASSDNVGVTGYDIYRGTTLAGTATTTSFSDSGLTASTTYSYTVKAKDAAGNISSSSNSISVTTLTEGQEPITSLTLPDWTDAGYKGGQSLPSGGTIIDLTTKGIAANDGNDDSAALQNVIDNIRNGSLTVNGSQVSESNRAILMLPAGQIDLSSFIRVDASWITLRGAGSDSSTGTNIVFKPASTYVSDNGLPVIDGKLWPGYGAFRVEDREKHPDEQAYDGSINFHWKSGVQVASSGGGSKGSTNVYLASGKGGGFNVGDTIYVGAANTVEFYQLMEAPAEYWVNQHMRSQMFEVVSKSGDTLTIDKPLEFDIPYSNSGNILGTNYYSKVMKVKTVEGVGFEDFYFNQDISYTEYSNVNANDYNASSNPNGVGLKYTNEAPEYAIHAIVFKWAQNGWVKGIQTYMTGSHPIVTEFARHMEFRDNVIFGAWNKGKGGHGYFRGSKLYDSKIINNTIDRVRHLTLQWSATGNVISSNALTADMNLHGGWERNNLIEQNTITVPYLHRSWGEGEGGLEPEGGTWYPIWYGAGPHASKWSGATGENNVFFNNVMKKQETEGGSYNTYLPYNELNRIYQIGWNGSGGWVHLEKPEGTFINTWTYNETVDFSASPNSGTYDCYTYSGSSLLGSGTAVEDCDGGSTGDTQAPTAPTNLSAAAVSSSQIDLSWTASTDDVGVTGYEIYRGTTLAGTSTTTSFSDTGLTASTTYSYTVKAKDAAGNVSAASSSVSATTADSGSTTAELPVSTVTASTHDGNVPENTLDKDLGTRWSASGDGEWIKYDLGSEYLIDLVKIAFYNGDQRTSTFDIEVSTDNVIFTNVFSGVSSGSTLQLETFDFTDSTARYVRIVGHGNSSNTWNSFTEVEIFGMNGTSTGDTQAPTAPTNLSAAAASSSQIDLSWTASTDDVGVTEYNIYRGIAFVGTSSTTAFSDTGLTASTTYNYTVKAKDAAGNVSAASNTASATTLGQQTQSSLKVHYEEGDGGVTTDNDIRPYLKIVNEGTSDIPLSELKMRYYYKKESGASQTFTVDYAALGKSNVTGTFVSLASPTSTADIYVEVGFTSGAGNLVAGGNTGTIKTRMNNSDWTDYDESNDYSYNASYISFAEYEKITLYHNGTLIWGIEP